ncbi:ataxin-7-like protein 1 isoform X5 [Pristis pectinata]|nr:ataxin-7-like protein 1 isoform X5 [Pristis pectinata]XP_051885913.1 ataxin-7-like protein 1 isoform X5 [Pristis pectinata]XP_051885914.1 ataxin-7-like protein 1 isoform X5 [Pristis pectinata]XP_051885915.1 ataxin-7-like protein 1 isoform X5 [Pristis pectinata]XP_051885916.1 ataxin-7-like protein 1 isoform X5 [Pristis pectinata]
MPHTIPRPKGQERRHGSSCKATLSPASSTSNSTTSPIPMKSKACSSHTAIGSNSKPFKPPKDNLHTSNNKQHQAVFPSKVTRDKSCVPVPVVSLEKIPNLVKTDGANVKMSSTTATTSTTSSSSSSSTSSASLVKSGLTSTTSKSVPPSPEKILNGKAIVPPVIDKKHQNGTKSSNKSHKRLSEREFDPNRHCGVMDPETKKPCTRSLTCKTHSLNHRRAVPGRRKQFDILLAEHKARSREKETVKDKEHPQMSKETLQSQSMPTQEQVTGSLTNTGLETKVTSPAKSRPLNTVLASRVSATNSINNTATASNSATVLELPLSIIGDLASRMSSDEGEVDGSEETEKLDCHYSGHHPKPLGYCTFGSRLMGRGFYVFDRRWNRFRLALNSMVEKHLNSQMWKKIPPAADSPMPSPTTFSTSVLQPLSSPSAVYLSSSSAMTPSYVMTAPMLSSAGFVTTTDTNPIMSYNAAFPHAATAFSLMDSAFKAPSLLSPVPAVVPSPSLSKPPKTKTSRSSKVKDLPSRSDRGSCNKRKKPPPPVSSPFPSTLQSSASTSSFSGSHKRNCILNPGTALNSFPATSSYSAMSVHNTNNGTNALSAKIDPSGRTTLPGSSTDSIKHMSMVVSSIDPTLSVSSLVHHPGDHALVAHNAMSSLPLPFDKSEGKKRKSSSSSSKSSKITKMPGMNSVHKRSAANVISSVSEASNSSVSRQIGKSSSISLSQSSPSTTTSPAHGNRQPKIQQ